VSDSFNTGSRRKLAAIVWLTGGRTHDAMEKFMVKDFQDHSAINGKCIKFMVQNTNSEEVTTYREELNCMERI